MFFLQYLVILGAVFYVSSKKFNHDHESSEYILKSNGVLKTIVPLTKENGVKRLLCKGNLVLVALYNISQAKEWKVGDIVVGDPEWGCALNRDDKHAHAEYGFHGIIESVNIRTDNRVDMQTVPATLFDIFERAHIFYHHKQQPLDINNGHARKRRAIVPYQATGDDIPIGGIELNSTREFYEARMMLNKLKWHESFKQIVNMNYDDETDAAKGTFGFEDGVFWQNSEYYKSERISNGGAKEWELHCDNCYVYFKPDVIFEMQIDSLIGVKKYYIEMSGEFETNIDFRTEVHGEYSVIFDDVFHSSEEDMWMSVPLVQDIKMSLIPSFQVDIGAFIDIMSQGKTSLELGFHQSGKLTIVRDWSPTSQNQRYNFVPNVTGKVHNKNAFLESLLYYNISAMNVEINLKDNIFWKFPKNIFGFYLNSPIQVQASPRVEGKAIENDNKVLCLKSNASIGGQVMMDDVNYSIQLLGERLDTTLSKAQRDKSFYYMDNTLILNEDICMLQCNGPSETTAVHQYEDNTNKRIKMAASSPASIRPSNRIHFQVDGCRYTTYNMALTLDKLADFVSIEWPNRKLVVASCSVFNGDGRKVDIGASVSGTNTIDTNPAIVNKVGQLAVCADIPVVYMKESYVVIAVFGDTEFSRPHQEMFEETLRNTDAADLSFCEAPSNRFTPLSLGQSFPSGSIEEVMGTIDNRLLRNDAKEFIERLYQYPFDDIDFEMEETNSDWCGTESRACSACVRGLRYAWTSCADMMMSPGMVIKLHELAGIVKRKWPSDKLLVKEAWDERTSDYPTGRHATNSLHFVGRAAWLSLTSGDTSRLPALTALARCADFDMVVYTQSNYIQVMTEPMADLFQTHIYFPSSEILTSTSVQTLFHEYEYSYPVLDDEPEPIHLLDSLNADIKVSEHFTVSEFVARDRRYFRLDPKLVNCLQETRQYLREPIEILAGYKTRMHANYADIPGKEKIRFRSGQAVNIRLQQWALRDNHLLTLSNAVIRSCAESAQLGQRVIGLSLHPEWIHLQIRRASEAELDSFVQVWNEGGNVTTYSEIQRLTKKVLLEGPAIVPDSWEVACEMPEMGPSKYYYQIDIRTSCRDVSADFCRNTQKYRQQLVEKVRHQMQPILGFIDGPLFLKDADIDNCLEHHCGSCNGGGSTWMKKLVSCSNVIHTIRKHMYRELKPDKGAFFNIERIDSHVQSLACRGLVCVEDLQIFAVFAPIIMSTYIPHEGKAQRERLYDSDSNPSPLIELIEQEMALHVEGIVHIFLEEDEDLSALRNVIKILMLYNKEVDKIVFHISDTLYLDTVYERIQNAIETWRYTTCPLWSRFTMAPYEVVLIPSQDITLSMETHKEALRMRESIRNWEMSWITKI